MIHWAFLIPAFIAGFAAGCAFFYYMAALASRVTGAIERACDGVDEVE